MGLVLPVETERIEGILKALEQRGWVHPPRAAWHYREKLVDGKWVWFGKLTEQAYILSSDVLPEAEGEDFLKDYRQGLKGLQEETEAVRLELGLPGLTKVDLEWAGD